MERKRAFFVFFAVGFFLFLLTRAVPVESQQNPVLSRAFQEAGYGYTIAYPADWTYVMQSVHTVIFRSDEKGKSIPNVVIQNINSTKVEGGKYSNADAVKADMENQLKAAENVKIYQSGVFTYNKVGKVLTGRQFVAEYTLQKERYREWVVIVPRSDGRIFHTWMYTAKADEYNKGYPIAKAMLDSWTITE